MKKRWLYAILCLLWMFMIFEMSNAQGEQSKGMSDTIVIFLSKIVPFVKYNDFWTFLVRKAAHFSEYAILGILYYQFLSTYRRIQRKELILLIGSVFLYACTDEIHQLFMMGRAGQLRDVLIDTSGGTTGILLLHGGWYAYRNRKHQQTSKNT